MSDLDDLSLEELLGLRESILEAKLNLTYYIEESDDDDDYDDEDNEAESNDKDADNQEDEDDDDDDDEKEVNEAVSKHDTDVDSHLYGKIEEAEHDQIKKKVPATHEASTTENLLALREGLIAEI